MRIWRAVGGIPIELGDAGDASDAPDASVLGGVAPRRRSLWAAGALAAGFWIARLCQECGSLPSAAAWFAVCQGVLIGALLSTRLRCRVLLFLATVVFAGGWYAVRFGPGPADRLDVLLRATGGASADVPILATVTGVVLEAPRKVVPRVGVLGEFVLSPAGWVFPVRTEALEVGEGGVRAQGVVRVHVAGSDGAPPGAVAGERVRVTGAFRPTPAPLNPGEPDRRLLALQEGVVGRMTAPSPSLIERIGEGRTARGTGAKVVAWARSRAAGALDLSVGEEGSPEGSGRALLGAMLLGAREPGLDEVEAAFRRVGLVHLVAISGFNLALLAWAASIVLRLAGERGRLESLGVAALISLYMLIVPAESPVLRAGVTVIAFLITEALGRRYDRLTLLGWVACGLLLWRPLDAWSMGFQLSFGIVAALLWLGRRAEERIFGTPLRGVVSIGVPIGEREGLLVRWIRGGWKLAGGKLKEAVSASLLAWGTAAPVIMVHTGVLSPWAPLTGLAALPVASVTLCVGYLALLVGFIWPAGGASVGEVAVWGADVLAAMVMSLDEIPGATAVLPRVSAWWGAAAVAVVLYWFARGSWRRRRAWVLSVVIVAWLGVELDRSTSLGRQVVLRVDTFAVGDGTCHLIRSGGEALLWDCGSSYAGLGLRDLPLAMREVGGWRVRSALVTHSNLDHFLCLPDVIPTLGIERVYTTRSLLDEALDKPRGATAALVKSLHAQRVTIFELHAGESFQLGESTCEILSPGADASYAEANDDSLVGLFRVRTSDGERRLLMTGDIGPRAIDDLQRRLPDLGADALELPHHGSAKTEAIAFLARIDPTVVLQSTGPQRVGDARWDAVRSARAWGVTARDGALFLEITRHGRWRFGSLRGGSIPVTPPSPAP